MKLDTFEKNISPVWGSNKETEFPRNNSFDKTACDFDSVTMPQLVLTFSPCAPIRLEG